MSVFSFLEPFRDPARELDRLTSMAASGTRAPLGMPLDVYRDDDGSYQVDLLAELGLSPEQALAAASTRAQQYFECAHDGSLVTYATDPRDDPWTLANPAAVVIRGVRVR